MLPSRQIFHRRRERFISLQRAQAWTLRAIADVDDTMVSPLGKSVAPVIGLALYLAFRKITDDGSCLHI
ncbi:hypothetical protein WK92_23445 [Burkholderia ubonensis]|nr:hypothetical protein WK82_15240 [Burkholderia ubonensis]KVW14899.1 hypothetical protein WK92_23445 [Burkholderia ubonensis]KVW47581.1 hypothetical protein WK95_05835 [Burkholderia ubonensis]